MFVQKTLKEKQQFARANQCLERSCPRCGEFGLRLNANHQLECIACRFIEMPQAAE
jgi:ribosomal protein S27AE